MITITWHLLLLIVVVALMFCLAVTRSTKGYFGSPRLYALMAWVVGTLVIGMIYGGFVWW